MSGSNSHVFQEDAGDSGVHPEQLYCDNDGGAGGAGGAGKVGSLYLFLKYIQLVSHYWVCNRIYLIQTMLGTNCMSRTLALFCSMSHGT